MSYKADKLREIAREAFRRGEKDSAKDIWTMAKAEDDVEEEKEDEEEEDEGKLESMSDDEIDAELGESDDTEADADSDDDDSDDDATASLPEATVASLKKLALKIRKAGHPDLAKKITAALG